MSAVNTIFDVIFLVDIIFIFRTKFINQYGDTVVNQKEISKRYIRGTFAIDLLSTIPFDFFASIFV